MPSPVKLLKKRLDALRVLETSYPLFTPDGEFVGRADHFLLTYTPKDIVFADEKYQLTEEQILELIRLCRKVIEIASDKEGGAE